MIGVLLSYLTACNLPPTTQPDNGDGTVVYPGTLLVTATEPNGLEQKEIEDRLDVTILSEEGDELARGVTGSRMGGLPVDTVDVRLGDGDPALQTQDGCWFFEVKGEYRVHEPTFAFINDEEGASVSIATHTFTGEANFTCTVTANDVVASPVDTDGDGTYNGDELRGPNQIYTFTLDEQWIGLQNCRDLVPSASPTFGGVLQSGEVLGLSGNGLTVYGGSGTIPIVQSSIAIDGDFTYDYHDSAGNQLVRVACNTTAE